LEQALKYLNLEDKNILREEKFRLKELKKAERNRLKEEKKAERNRIL